MKRATAAVKESNLAADVAILKEMVAYVFAQTYATASSEIELDRFPERLTNRMDEQLESLKHASTQAHTDAVIHSRERLQLMLSALNAYRKSAAAPAPTEPTAPVATLPAE